MHKELRYRMLVVEDELSYQELYADILSAHYELTMVSSKEAAMSSLRKQSFDIALVDMRLKANERGNIDGIDVIEFIRALNIPTVVILNSGFPTQTPEITARLKKLDVFAVLDKSADGQVEKLTETIAQALAKQKAELLPDQSTKAML